MRLVGQIHVTVRGDIVKRNPTLWEKLKGGLGGSVNLATDRMHNHLEATVIVDVVRRALQKMDVSNALSLVIDDTIIFQDSDGKPDDLPDLAIALSEHASVFGRGFRELRFAAEHQEAGLHLIIETRARTQHHRNEPAAIVSVGGRLGALEAAKGETAETYRARVEPLIKDAALFQTAKHAFESFVTRLEGVLRAGMPDALVEEKKAETRLVHAKKPGDLAAPERAPKEPMHPGYDPFLVYYPSPMGMMLDAMIFSSFMHMMMPPPFMMMTPAGAPLGTLPEVQANPDLLQAEPTLAADHRETGAEDHGQGDSSDGNAADESSAWDSDGFGSDDGGGGFDSGGGFDGGGFD
jgi:hypothetical protein